MTRTKARTRGQTARRPLDPPLAPPIRSDEPPLFVMFDERGMEGLIDAAGNVAVPPAFDAILPPTEGLCAMCIDGRWGFMSPDGRVVVQPRWALAQPFSDGLALVVERQQRRQIDDSTYERSFCGFVNRNGEYAIPPVWYSRCSSFHEGLAAAEVDRTVKESAALEGWAGYFDTAGRWAIPPRYHGTDDFSNGFGLVRRISDRGKEVLSFVDAHGTALKLPAGWAPTSSFSENLAAVRQASRACVGAVNREGALVFSIRARALQPFSEGRAVFEAKGRFGYVDASGKIVVRPTLFCAESFSDGLARVCLEGVDDERYVNANGEFVLGAGEGRPYGNFRGSLQLRVLKTRTIRERPGFRNLYGYRNTADKYVWLSPGSEKVLDPAFWRKNYVGPPRISAQVEVSRT